MPFWHSIAHRATAEEYGSFGSSTASSCFFCKLNPF